MAERDDEELLAAFLDGVGELTPAERKRAEAALTPADAEATRALLGQLRALPPEGTEPDWTAMERSISIAVGPRVPRPWWSISWRWAIPVIACGATAIAVVIASRPEAGPAPLAHVESPRPVAAPAPPSLAAGALAPMVYLDGEAMDIEAIDAIDPLEAEAMDFDGSAAADVADEDSLLGGEHWVDHLDDRALDRAERILTRPKSLPERKKT